MSDPKPPPSGTMPESFPLAHRLGILLARFPVRGRGLVRWGIRRFLLPKPNGPAYIHTQFGVDLVVDPIKGGSIERELYFDGVYEAGTLDIIGQVLRPGDTVIDVGANIGLMSLAASLKVKPEGRVYAVEPEPETFAILANHVRLNGATTVIPVKAALGSSNGTSLIHTRKAVGRGSATLAGGAEEGGKSAVVAVDTLDGFHAAHDIGEVRLLKIDVEGWELEVLKGGVGLLSGKHAPIVIIECSSLHPLHGGSTTDIFALLVSMNDYRIFRLKKGKSSPSPLVQVRSEAAVPRHDNLFCFLPAHIAGLPRTLFAHA